MSRQSSVNKKKQSSKNNNNNLYYIITTISAALIILFSFYYYMSHKKNLHPSVKTLVDIIEKIDQSCRIQKCINQHNTIDFLNVKEFAGNTVGSIILEKPEKWIGPYVDTIIMYNEKPLSLFVNSLGCYIVPSNDTVLEDGATIGKDIIFDDTTDMKNIIKDYPSLCPQGMCLIGKVDLSFSK
jgi:hypothetical protein